VYHQDTDLLRFAKQLAVQKNRSQHARGQAADFECHTVDNKQLFEWVTNELDYDQAILEFYTGTPESGWLHISYNKDGNRKQKLRAFRNDAGKTQYEEI
jgi:hypothetical protein